MGSVHVEIVVEHPGSSGKRENCRVQADTGATLTVLPKALLVAIGVMPEGQREFMLADGRKMSRAVGEARVRINGDAVVTRVVFGESGDASLLGVTALEELGLMVDPVARRLIPTTYQMF